MKKNNFWALVAGITCSALSLFAFASCDDDVDASVALSGDWDGDFGMYYDYYDRHGRFVETFDCYDTDISFYPDYDYATHGYGYQVDFYRYGPYTKIYHSFEWEIHNCDVYLYYIGERELDTVIRDYRLSSSYFTGYFNDSNTRFSLRKYRDYYDWDPYWDDYGTYNHGTGYGYYYRDDWYYDDDFYYARTRSAAPAIDTEELKADGKEFTIHYGNRFNQK